MHTGLALYLTSNLQIPQLPLLTQLLLHPQSSQEKGCPCLLNFAFVGILELTFYFTVQNVLMPSHKGSQ